MDDRERFVDEVDGSRRIGGAETAWCVVLRSTTIHGDSILLRQWNQKIMAGEGRLLRVDFLRGRPRVFEE